MVFILSLNVDEILQPLGQELFARRRVLGDLLRLQPAAYQVAECLSELLHGWQMVLSDKGSGGDDAHFRADIRYMMTGTGRTVRISPPADCVPLGQKRP